MRPWAWGKTLFKHKRCKVEVDSSDKNEITGFHPVKKYQEQKCHRDERTVKLSMTLETDDGEWWAEKAG